MKLYLNTVAAFALCGLLLNPAAQAQTVTPSQWLAAQPKPAYKTGHTLPRLTRFAANDQQDLAYQKELAENWGYAVQFGGYTSLTQDGGIASKLNDLNSYESKIAALTIANPQRYPLAQIGHPRDIPGADAPAGSWIYRADGTIVTGSGQSADGTLWGDPNGPMFSPEAPELTWQMTGSSRAAVLTELTNRGIPVNIVLNGGEYGIGVIGHEWEPRWSQSPTILAAVNQSVWGQYDNFTTRNNYASGKKANSERIIANALKAASPQRSLYVYYTAGGSSLRNKDWASSQWQSEWQHTRGISDIPSNEAYYRHYNDGFTGRLDLLTLATNAMSLELATGDALSYNWITAGWSTDPNYVAETNRWTGFLKCYFTLGMIGCNVGNYGAFTTPERDNFPSTTPPPYLKELAVTSHVQALFSQVEGIVRNSDLLQGPAMHRLSPTEPAYEFPTGDDNARVLARKHRTAATWLITAWAADGANRNVSVYIPELGNITLEARIVGSVYTATLSGSNVTLTRIDNEGATYTAVANGTPVVTQVNLTVPSPIATNRLLWLSADSEVTVDGSGNVSSWGSIGNNTALGQTDATKRPTLVANAINGKPALRFVNGQTWMTGDPGDNNFNGTLSVFAVFTPGSTTNKAIIGMQNATERVGMNDNTIGVDAFLSSGMVRKTEFYAIVSPVNYMLLGENLWTGGGAGFGLTGDIAEILVYKNLSGTEVTRVKSYLDDKYSLKPDTAISNGSFESPVVTGYTFNAVHRNELNSGWVFANYSAIQANGSGFNAPTAPNGIQTAVLQGSGGQLGNLSQTVNFAAGNYTVSFKAARRNGQIQAIKVSLDSVQIGALITPASDSFADYTTASFYAPAGFHALRLEATDATGDKSTFIDQVALTKVAASSSGFVNFFNTLYAGTRSNHNGNLGYEFTPAANIIVTALGRPVSGTMANDHTIKIWKVSDQSVVATATVTPTSATDSLGYKYIPLSSSVTLTSGTAYRITSNETSGGDAWMNLGSISNHLTTATVSQAVWATGDTYPLNFGGAGEVGYVAPAFYTGSAPPPPLLNFFNAAYTGLRNDHTGNVGYEFTPAANITVTALGRPVSGTMANSHGIKIWKVSDQSVVASTTVTPTSATDSLGYKYEVLASSVTLSSGTTYRITTTETSGGDAWMNVASISNHLTTATVSQAAWATGDTYPLNLGAGGEVGYAAPTFYTSDAAAPAALAAPTTLASNVSADGRVNLNWADNSANETGFIIERKTGAGGTYAQVASLGANATTFSEGGLTPGTQYFYRVKASNGTDSSAFTQEANPTTLAQLPFGGTARAIPGTIEAEAFDTGGEGVAYHDDSVGNTPGAARTAEDVDLENTTDIGSGTNGSSIANGEWLEYTVNVTAGTYNLTFRAASGGTGGQIKALLDGVDLGTVTIPDTGGWQTWVDATLIGKTLDAGNGKILRLEFTGGINLNKTTISANLPSPWQTADIGTVGLAGSVIANAGSYTIKGSGIGITGTADQFRYVYQTLSGDGSITARINSQSGVLAASLAGVMVRETTDANSRFAMVAHRGAGTNNMRATRRTTSGGTLLTTSSASQTPPNCWVRVTRTGNSLAMASSTNGTTWTTISTTTVTMTANVTVGLAVTSGNNTLLDTDAFSSITVVP